MASPSTQWEEKSRYTHYPLRNSVVAYPHLAPGVEIQRIRLPNQKLHILIVAERSAWEPATQNAHAGQIRWGNLYP